jgi:hypothetical protein
LLPVFVFVFIAIAITTIVFVFVFFVFWEPGNVYTHTASMESRMDQYEIIKQIGKGAFGCAILVYHKLEGRKYGP